MNIAYIKHSNNRKKRYQIRTLIKNNKVEKHPIYSEGIEHIRNISRNYSLLSEIYNIEICNNFLYEGHIEFEYIHGQTLNEYLLNIARNNNKEIFLKEIKDISEKLINISEKAPFQVTKGFQAIFGNNISSSLEEYGWETFLHSNIDINFDNIIRSNVDNKLYMVDYEWVYSFPVPIKYIQFRSLFYFFTSNYMVLQELVLFQEILNYVGLSDIEVELFKKMDVNFISSITDESYYLSNYSKKSVDIDLNSLLTAADFDHYGQIYIVDSEGKINEENSLKQNLMLSLENAQNVVLKFENIELSETYGFRFDPLNQSCFIQINEIKSIINNKVYPLAFSQMNAFVEKNGKMLFLSEDPQIYIFVDNIINKEASLKYSLVIDYTIIDTNVSVTHKYFPIIEEMKKTTSDMERLNEQFYVVKAKNESLEKENETLLFELKDLKHSRDIIINELELKKTQLAHNIEDIRTLNSKIDQMTKTTQSLSETIDFLNNEIDSMKIKNRIKKLLKRFKL
ncbi:TPA: hypothetical protein ACG3KH_004015 [Clostridioides difficile]